MYQLVNYQSQFKGFLPFIWIMSNIWFAAHHAILTSKPRTPPQYQNISFYIEKYKLLSADRKPAEYKNMT